MKLSIKQLIAKLPLPFWLSFYIFLILIAIPTLAYIGTFGKAAVPQVITNNATDIVQTSAVLNGSILDSDNAITARGFEWGTTTSYGSTINSIVPDPSNYSLAKTWNGKGLAGPADSAIDSNGNIYVTDRRTSRVKKYSNSGNFISQWGTGYSSSNLNGTGDGDFNGPTGIAVDTSDNIYVVDTGNNRIQKFNTSGVFVAKWGTSGNGNGQFNNPLFIAIDSSGNIYVTDSNNDRVQKFNSDGTYITKWGTNGTGNGQFTRPKGIAIDANDNVYTTDGLSSPRVQKFNSNGVYIIKWGSYGSGNGQFVGVGDIAIDNANNIYVSNSGTNIYTSTIVDKIQKFTDAGTFMTSWGVRGDSTGQFNGAYGLAIDSANSMVIVSELFNSRLQYFDTSGTYVSKLGDREVAWPLKVVIDKDNSVYITENASPEYIKKYDSSGNFLYSLKIAGNNSNAITDVAIDSDGNLYIAYNNSPQKVNKYSSSGVLLNTWNIPFAAGNHQRIIVDSLGYIYYVDDTNFVTKFDSNFNLVAQFGSAGTGNGQFTGFADIAIDSNDVIYIYDSYGRIQRFTSSGTYLSQFGSAGTGNGQFGSYGALTFDTQDNLFVADSGNNRVQKFSNLGTFVTKWGDSSYSSNPGQFIGPWSIAVDSRDMVWVPDFGNTRVQVFMPPGNFVLGDFSESLSGLACNTTYHYRAYAANNNGTSYGQDQTFTTSACAQDPFIMTVKTDNPGASNNKQYTIPTNNNYTYNYSVDCNNDGTPEYSNQTGNVTCTFGTPGTYDIAITGTFPHLKQPVSGDQEKIIDVKQWGDIQWQSMESMFSGATNITTFTATDVPNLSQAQSMNNMFRGAIDFNSNLNSWNVSNISDMGFLFADAQAFNQPLNNWNVGNVTITSAMFANAISFNQPLNNWNTSNVTDMGGMFATAKVFNQNIDNWDVSNVVNMENTFGTTFGGNFLPLNDHTKAFNQPLNSWDTSSVTDMSGMFALSPQFNQPLNNWNTSNVTDTNAMFIGATSFNQNINNWDVSSISTFGGMFALATSFNQPLNGWNTSSMQDISAMFLGATNFNQPLNSWDTSNVAGAMGAFGGATSFDQSLADWDVSSADNMQFMFGDLQDLTKFQYEMVLGKPYSQWTQAERDGYSQYFSTYVGVTISLNDPPKYSGLSTLNYDATLIGWSLQTLQSNVTFDAGTSKYCNSVAQRQSIITDFIWTINDSGKDCPTIHISDCQQLQSISINPVTYEPGNVNANYVLDNNIDCSETATWIWDGVFVGNTTPVGFAPILGVNNSEPFTGTFDGQGHTISNLYQDARLWTDQIYLGTGLFEFTQDATVKNVVISNSTVYGSYGKLDDPTERNGGSAGLIGLMWRGTVENVHIKELNMQVSGLSQSAGLVRSMIDGYIYNSSVQGDIFTAGTKKFGVHSMPDEIAVDSHGDIYVQEATILDGSINKYDDTGAYKTKLNLDLSLPPETGLGDISIWPGDMVTDNSGNVLVVDHINAKIQKFNSNGDLILQFGTEGYGDGEFKKIRQIAIDGSNNIYVYDQDQTNGPRIQKYDSNGNYISQFTFPSFNIYDMAVDSNGDIYILDDSAYLKKLSNSGVLIRQIGVSNDTTGLALDSSDNVYVADKGDNKIKKYDTGGNLILEFGTQGLEPGQLDVPSDVAITGNGDILVSDSFRVQRFDAGGNYIISSDIGKHKGMTSLIGGVVGLTLNTDPNSTAVNIEKTFSNVNINKDEDAERNRFLSVGGISSVAMYGNIINSYSKGDITVKDKESIYSFNAFVGIGGLLGYNAGSVSNSYSSSNIDVDTKDLLLAVGGVVGIQSKINLFDSSPTPAPIPNSLISNSFFAGNLTTHPHYVLPESMTEAYQTGDIEIDSFLDDILTQDPYGNLVGFFIGSDSDNLPSFTNNYYDEYKNQATDCYSLVMNTSLAQLSAPNNFNCTPVNPNNSQPNYFKNNTTNPPLNTWDFASIWKTTCDYPIFVWQTDNCATAPTVPLNPSITDVTTTSMKLNWQPPADDGGSAITSYQVQYKASSSSTWINAPAQEPSPTSHVFTNLSPNTSYDFKVAAINAIGTSPYTNPISGSTLAEPTTPEPPQPPQPCVPTASNPCTPPPPKCVPSATNSCTTNPETPTTNEDTNTPEPGTPIYSPTTKKPTISPAKPNQTVKGSFMASIVNQARKLPKPAARAIPYTLLALLLALASLYAYSSYMETKRRKAIQALVTRFKSMLAARATFLRITSHYISTPITKMQGVVELLASGITSTSSNSSSTSKSNTTNSSTNGSNPDSNSHSSSTISSNSSSSSRDSNSNNTSDSTSSSTTPQAGTTISPTNPTTTNPANTSSTNSSSNSTNSTNSNQPLPPPVALAASVTTLTIPEDSIVAAKSGLKSLANHSAELLAEGQSLTGAQQANIRNLEQKKGLSFLTNPSFWLPVVVISTIVVLLNFIFIQANRYTPTAITILSQLLLGFVGVIALGVSYYFYRQQKATTALLQTEQTIEQEFNTRQANFISEASNKLSDDLLLLDGISKDIAKYPKTTGFTDGLKDLKQIVAQLEKLSQLSKYVPGLNWSTDLSQTISNTTKDLDNLANKQSVTITTNNLTPSTLVAIESSALNHLIAAPLKNAIQASNPGNQVTITQTTNPKDKLHPITLTITDQGKGIPANKLQDIFTPFNSAHSLERFTDTGLGLDLYLAKVVTEAYGATIDITSQENVGTTVAIGLGRAE